MEIFERMSWYGWFTVMALYVTGSVETGGLGFDTETRGMLMAIVPFFLYLFPAIFGALADRYGFRRMFLASTMVMIPGYLLLGLIALYIVGGITGNFALTLLAILVTLAFVVITPGFYMIQPNQSAVLTLFGDYKGSDASPGLRWANPLYVKKKVSLRVRNSWLPSRSAATAPWL